MSEHIWISTPPSLFETHFGFHWPPSMADRGARIALSDALKLDSEKGVPLAADRFPDTLETQFTPTPGDPHKSKLPVKLPHFVKWICPVISKDIADILRQFDIGATNLYPVAMRRADNGTTYDQDFFILNVGVAKDTLVHDQSRGLKEYKLAWTFYRYRSPQEDGLAVKRSVLDGSDVWLDPILRGGMFFVSDRLHNALSHAGLAAPLAFKRCRVV